MTYRGVVKNGVVVLEDGEGLSDGTVVRVEPLATADADGRPSVYERLEALAGRARDLPHDLARRHDHYLHGRADS
jgi:hypothetical protein